jgi:hypothetical protein
MAKFTKLLVDDTRVLQAFAVADGWDFLIRGEDVPGWIETHGWPEAVALDYDLNRGEGVWDGGRVAECLREAFIKTGRPTSEFPIWDAHSSVAACNEEIAAILAEYAQRRQPGLAPLKRG